MFWNTSPRNIPPMTLGLIKPCSYISRSFLVLRIATNMITSIDCCCDTHEVYQSYCQFLAVTQNGRKTEFSKIQFNKKFREISKSKFIYKRPHRSRKGPSPYCYIGLKLPETFPQSEAAPSAPQEGCLMRYLKHIEKYQLTGQMKTTLDIPPSKK